MTGEHPPAGEGQEGAREKAPRSVGRKQRRESHLSLASLGASFSASAKGKGAAPHHRHELRPNLTEPQGGPSSLADLYNAGATDLRRSLEDFAFPTKTASTSTDPFFHTSEPPVPQPSTSAAAAFSPCTTSRSALESPIPATPLQGFADAHLERSQSTQPPMPHHRRPSSWGKNRLLAVASPLMCSPNFSEPVPSAHARSHSRSHSFQHDHQHHRCSLSSASRQTPRCSHTHDLSRASSAASHKISSHPQRRRSRSQLVYMLSDWGFCSLDLTHDELLHCCELLFEAALSLPADTEGNTCNGPTIGHAYGITPLQIRGFINAISALYVGSNAYHNFVHATDVLQAVYSFLCELGALPGLREALLPSARQELGHPAFDVRASPVRPADALAMLFAAIGHDAGHPGLSNAFLVNGKTTLARAFHDKSPLENYHALLLEGMLSLHGLDALVWQEQPLSEDSARPAEPSPRKRTAFGDMVRNCVLATDMALHFGFVTALEKFEERWNVHDEVLAAEVQKAVGLGIGVSDLHAFELPTNDGILEKRLARAKEMRVLPQADRTMLCSALIKCADVSNPARPTGVGRQWSLALRQEWSRQMALEQDCGLPATVGGSVRCCNKVASRPEVDRDELATTFAEDTVNQRRRSSAAQMVAGVGGGGGAHATWREYDLDEIDDLEEELALAKGQVCFVDLFVAPLFIAVGRVLPGACLCFALLCFS